MYIHQRILKSTSMVWDVSMRLLKRNGVSYGRWGFFNGCMA